MSAAGERLGDPVARSQRVLVAVLLLLAAAAWAATGKLMAGMDAGPGTSPGSLGFYSGSWAVMMAAMMLPSLAPAAIAYGSLRAQSGRAAAGVYGDSHDARGAAAGGATAVGVVGAGLVGRMVAKPAGRAASALFVIGYLALWAFAGLIGYAVLEIGHSLDGGLFAWARAGRFTAAGVLALAAAYELSPRKHACLSRCRTGEGLPARWRGGAAGALRMGFAHGTWCLGCCWALMAALFALGSMSLAWMVVIAAAIAAEKLLPWPRASALAVAALLAALAIGIAASPPSVPGLTIPHPGMAMRGMSSHETPSMGSSAKPAAGRAMRSMRSMGTRSVPNASRAGRSMHAR